MKTLMAIGILSACLIGCASPRLSTRQWHTSPDPNPRLSDLYAVVDWSVVEKLRIGMSVVGVKNVVGLLLTNHPVNAILFTKYENQEYEVALRLSMDKKSIKDISYKRRN